MTELGGDGKAEGRRDGGGKGGERGVNDRASVWRVGVGGATGTTLIWVNIAVTGRTWLWHG